MASILKSFIPHLIARCDLTEIIDARVPLKKQGKNYVACCPFHQENTPSFTITPEKQFYYCFGCGAGGNVISFVMAYDRLSFVEAVETLASQYKLTVPYDSAKKNIDQRKTADLYVLLEQAAQCYQKHLQNTPHAQRYLEKRGLSKALIQKFGLGYAPDGWHTVYPYLYKAGGYTATDVQAVGLIIAKSNEKEYYDRFRDRIMFPIRDRRGRMIGFGGRGLNLQTIPKYLNSPETSLFRKSYELYGLYEALQQSSTQERIWVVEGYMDVLSLVENGIKNVVATLGTATSRTHIQRLFSITQEVIFCFDGDSAGKAAAWRALEISLSIFQDGWSLRFLILPEGEDPDSLIQKDQNGLNHKKSLALEEFFFQTLSHNSELNTSTGRAKFAKQALTLLDKMPPSVSRQHLFERLSHLVGTEVKSLTRLNTKTERQSTLLKISYSPLDRAIAALLQKPEWASQFNEALQVFTEKPYLQLKAFAQFVQQMPQASSGILLEYFRDQTEIYEHIKPLIYREQNVSELIAVQEFQDILVHLHKMERSQKIEQLMQKAKLKVLSEVEQQQLYRLLGQNHEKK